MSEEFVGGTVADALKAASVYQDEKDKKIAELRLELKILQRAYDELYREKYGCGHPMVYAHV